MRHHLIILLTALMLSPTIGAQRSQHSVGGILGSMNGLSYKVFLSESHPWALEIDMGIRLNNIGGVMSTVEKAYVGDSIVRADCQITPKQWIYSIECNPNIVYQNAFFHGRHSTMDVIAGLGTSMGVQRFRILEDNHYFKFGMNAIMGMEFNLSAAPLSIDWTFRPGWGMTSYNEIRYIEKVPTRVSSKECHFFDWALSLGLRYRIPTS